MGGSPIRNWHKGSLAGGTEPTVRVQGTTGTTPPQAPNWTKMVPKDEKNLWGTAGG